MADPDIPEWLRSLPLAPTYRPTETEFADPIAFISRIEREASAFGICKVLPPLPKPSRRFVVSNINRSLSLSPDTPPPPSSDSNAAVFTTRHQELGSRRSRLPVHKQVWQSGESYTLDQFESKSKAFSRTQLSGFKEVTPLLIESLFWKAAAEKPISVEYANDVPGSGFIAPSAPPFRRSFFSRRKKRKSNPVSDDVSGAIGDEGEGTAGWKLSNSPWNLQVIARAPGSVTRFMPDDVPGVTSPMVYIGMLFSWFAWHIEDHELHSLNFLHMGAPKTWYAVPGEYAANVEEIVRVKGYGGDVDRLASFIMLGEKTTLLSPEVLVAEGIPCCRLVQNPGEFVVTFPRAYHIGFSHGFNCGEAANFATPKWLKVAKEAAVRRAAMNHLPMLSYQQLLYMLTMSFISRVPRALLPGVRSSRLRDRKKEEREYLIKKAFLNDMLDESHLLCLLMKCSTSSVVLWEPDLLPSMCNSSQSLSSSLEANTLLVNDEHGTKVIQHIGEDKAPFVCKTEYSCADSVLHEANVKLGREPCNDTSGPENQDNSCNDEYMDFHQTLENLDEDDDEDDLPCGLNFDSGTLTCVACGTLGYPFMAIMQPSRSLPKYLSPLNDENTDRRLGRPRCLKPSLGSCIDNPVEDCDSDDLDKTIANSEFNCKLSSKHCDHVPDFESPSVRCGLKSLINDMQDPISCAAQISESTGEKLSKTASVHQIECCPSSNDEERTISSLPVDNLASQTSSLLGTPQGKPAGEYNGWDTTTGYLRARIFCLQHAFEIQELLQCKGGARILVICHSDFLKIKAYAVAVAEDIDIQFDLKEFKMENASQSELDLINSSIDDEEHEDNGEDWTSRLDLNLRYCVKLRKESPSNQERLTLALGGMFSDPPTVSNVSNLRWRSRKSRTQTKVIGSVFAKSRPSIDAVAQRVESIMRSTTVESVKEIQVYDCHKRSRSVVPVKARVRLRQDVSTEWECNNGTSVDDDQDDQERMSGYIHPIEAEADYCKNLVTVPVLAAESFRVHQDIWRTLRTKSSDEVFSSIGSEKLGVHTKLATAALTEGCPGNVSNLPNKAKSELEQDVGNSELKQSLGLSEPLESVNSGTQHTQVVQKNSSEHLQQHVMADEIQRDMGDCGSVLLEDQCATSILLSRNSEVHSEVLDGQDIESKGDIQSSLTSERQPAAACELLQDIHIEGERNVGGDIHCAASMEVNAQVTNAINAEVRLTGTIAAVQRSLTSEKQTDSDAPMANASEMLQEHIQGLGERDVEEDIKCPSSMEVDAHSMIVIDSVGPIVGPIAASSGVQAESSDSVNADLKRMVDTSASVISFQNTRVNGRPTIVYKRAARHKKKRKEVEPISVDQHCYNDFVRSPCEGLRPRIVRENTGLSKEMDENPKPKMAKSSLARQKHKDTRKEQFDCDIEGCDMSFGTRAALDVHKNNRCTYKGCRKRFSSHRYAMRHQRVHEDTRPLRCPWEGCGMSFKWEWARKEHIRVHTGERPYQCKDAGCGMTFRFVSDFSRHRRKTGHSGNSAT